ncbi:MAG: hypothetical protein AAGI03_07095 [Pseudomonadota bacterium]
MKNMLFGIEMLGFYGIVLAVALWELYKTSKLPGLSKTEEHEKVDDADE